MQTTIIGLTKADFVVKINILRRMLSAIASVVAKRCKQSFKNGIDVGYRKARNENEE